MSQGRAYTSTPTDSFWFWWVMQTRQLKRVLNGHGALEMRRVCGTEMATHHHCERRQVGRAAPAHSVTFALIQKFPPFKRSKEWEIVTVWEILESRGVRVVVLRNDSFVGISVRFEFFSLTITKALSHLRAFSVFVTKSDVGRPIWDIFFYRNLQVFFFRANLVYVLNIEIMMQRKVGSRCVHDFGNCEENKSAPCRFPTNS